jgi:anti-anti-sigma factor
VIDMQLEYISGQSLRDFIFQNEDRIHDILSSQVKDFFQQVDSQFAKAVFDTFHKMIHFIVEDREHELVVLAKVRGQAGAKTDYPLVVLLELIQSHRKVYWGILHYYFKQVELDKEGFFHLERKTNSLFDTYIMHYFSSYIEYKDQLLRAQREIIEDLTVPIIPISSTMAVLPILGTVDTYRAKRIQEQALTKISHLKTEKVFIDLSGVAFMDTAVVGHLFRIVEGINLMGCKAIVTGIRPEIANTMINLGISLTGKIETKGTLQQAIEEFGLK